MRTSHGIALIAMIIAGCGGGGGSESTEVSASPSAPSPAAAIPSPGQAPAPSNPTAPPVEVPVPTPKPPTDSPESSPTPQPAPIPSPVAPPRVPGPVGDTISAAVLRSALSARFQVGSADRATGNALAIGSLEGDPKNLIHVGQSLIDGPAEDPPDTYYSQVSGQFANNNLTNVAIGVLWRNQVLGATIGAGSGPYSTTLTRPTPVALTDRNGPYTLDTTLAQWDAAPWFVQLQIQSDPRSNRIFRLCMHYRLPDVIRLSCGMFDRLTAEHRGVYLVDDSQGLGARTWETQ